MVEFRLNLVRDQVPPPGRRRIRYWSMVAYLGASGLVLVASFAWASKRLLQAADLRSQSRRLESEYVESRGGEGSIQLGAQRLHRRVAAQVASLQSVDRQLDTAIRPARLMKGLVLSLPPAISLRKFALDGEARTVTFELLVLGGTPERDAGPADLLADWQGDPAVSRAIKDVSYQGSQIEVVGDRSDVVWRFSAHLAGGGG